MVKETKTRNLKKFNYLHLNLRFLADLYVFKFFSSFETSENFSHFFSENYQN